MNLIAPILDIAPRSIHFELPLLPRLADLKSLDRLRARLDERASGELNAVLRDRLESLRERLRTMPFAEATNVVGRERLLLTLYLLDQGEGYMRPFDERVCEELLGDGSELRLLSRLRQAAHLFFAHFDHLPGHPTLGRLLRKALAQPDAASHRLAQAKCWRESRESLFTSDGPQRFVAQVRDQEKLLAAAERCGVLQPSRFFELAQQHYLLAGLRNLPFGDDAPIFDELIEQRATALTDGQPIGVAALKILISRCIKENKSRLPDKWGARIAMLGCDPRLPRRSLEFNRWWAWAGDPELAVVLQWFTGADLTKFLALLRGSLGPDAERMFERRERFLRALQNTGKIRDARLVLVEDAMRDARARFRDQASTSFARMRANAGGISVICLRLDGFYMVEGTHNFSLRMFQNFPIRAFWERERSMFSLRDFQEGSDKAIRHQGDWELKFENALMQSPFHLTWHDVRLR